MQDTTWHVAYTNPREEWSAAFHLARAGYRAFAPHCYVHKPQDRRAPHLQHTVKRHVFPRYVFMGVVNPEAGYYAATRCRGVHSLLMSGDKPAEVRPAFMAKLMARCEGDGWMRSADDNPALTESFEVGQSVKVTYGPFAGLIVQIARLDGCEVAEVDHAMFGSKRVTIAQERLTAA